jgi:hypothetical protein
VIMSMSVMMTGLAEVIPTLVVSVVAMLCEPVGTVRAVVPVATRLVGGSKGGGLFTCGPDQV